jgi:hypothetical protein
LNHIHNDNAASTNNNNNNKMPTISMKINGVEIVTMGGGLGEIEEVEDSNGSTKTKIPLNNFTGYILVDDNAPNVNEQGQAVGSSKHPRLPFDPCATPKEQAAAAAAAAAAGGGWQQYSTQTKPRGSIITSFNQHQPQQVIKVKEEQIENKPSKPAQTDKEDKEESTCKHAILSNAVKPLAGRVVPKPAVNAKKNKQQTTPAPSKAKVHETDEIVLSSGSNDSLDLFLASNTTAETKRKVKAKDDVLSGPSECDDDSDAASSITTTTAAAAANEKKRKHLTGKPKVVKKVTGKSILSCGSRDDSDAPTATARGSKVVANKAITSRMMEDEKKTDDDDDDPEPEPTKKAAGRPPRSGAPRRGGRRNK